MTSRFSGVLQLTDLDDFIAPSQECVKPIDIKRNFSEAKIKIREDAYHKYGNTEQKKLEKVQITLNDCLACSGCITSAESILISQQNFSEMLKALAEIERLKEHGAPKLVVVSLSIQPVLALAKKYAMSPENAAECLVTLFKNLGADKVIEISVAEDLALLEAQNEFVNRYRSNEKNQMKFPLLSSSCPGWICYAEKTHGNFILPFISTVKSPQQIIGSLVKYNLGHPPDLIYHITLMPCFDKKLEASRNEFFNSKLNVPDVDCVITSVELEQLMAEKNIDFTGLQGQPLDHPWGKESYSIRGHSGSGSGGYAHNILVHAAHELFGIELNEMNWKTLRNPDFMEMVVERNSEEVLRFAIANGFRNIQNVVQKIKKNKCNYHYVEIMACPSGCLNGGAQIKPDDVVSAKDFPLKLGEMYAALPTSSLKNYSKMVRKLYEEWLGGVGSDKCEALLRTSYRPVEKSKSALNIKW